MKKRYFVLLAFLCLCVRPLHAQQTFLWQPFDQLTSLNITGGWTHVWTGGVPWRAEEPYMAGSCMGVPGPNGTNKVAYINDCTAFFPNQSNVFMASPPMNLGNASNVYLRFLSSFRKKVNGSRTERATVEASTDGGQSWTVLLNVPPNADPAFWRTLYVPLQQYNNVPNLRLGFRYSDDSSSMIGWAVDNIKVYIPAQKDLTLVSMEPSEPLLSYVKTGDSLEFRVVVHNAGTSTVTDFDLHWQETNGPVYTTHISGINFPPFDSVTVFPEKYFVMPDLQQHTGRIWVSMPGDTLRQNDSLSFSLHGAAFIPNKVVAIEEGTGTWNMYGPQGIVLMHSLDTNDKKAALISVHDADPMIAKDYADYLFNMYDTYIPYYLMDRRLNVTAVDFYREYEHLRKGFGFADLQVEAGYIPSGRLETSITITPAVTLLGAHRVALVITENDVHSTDSGWAQANWYSGKPSIPMGGFENLADPVPAADMYYDFVARPGASAYWGEPWLPMTMQPSTPYNITLQAEIDPSWNRKKLRAVVLLVRSADSSVLNATWLPLGSLAVDDPVSGPEFRLYPNPARSEVVLELPGTQPAQIRISDLVGRSVFAGRTEPGAASRLRVNTGGWPGGMYTVTVQTQEGRSTKKLLVLH